MTNKGHLRAFLSAGCQSDSEGGISLLVERLSKMPGAVLTWVWFPGVAIVAWNFSPRVNLIVDSLSLSLKFYSVAPVSYSVAPESYNVAPGSYNVAPGSHSVAPVSYSVVPVSYNVAPVCSRIHQHLCAH